MSSYKCFTFDFPEQLLYNDPMSGTPNQFGGASMQLQVGARPVAPRAKWTWHLTSGNDPSVIYPIAYPPNQSPTKTGLMPSDVEQFLGSRIQYYGNTNMIPMNPDTIIQFIRYAEDELERTGSLLLCDTQVAASPIGYDDFLSIPNIAQSLQIQPVNGYYQQLGLDYDIAEAPYDFFFEGWKDEGWGFNQFRHYPVNRVQMLGFFYPLLNEYFEIPQSWFVLDRESAFLRIVPSANIQELPLFTIMLNFMGFAQTVPGGMIFMYEAGFRPYDYKGRWSIIREAILCRTAASILRSTQVGVNRGVTTMTIHADSLSQTTQYPSEGPFKAYIDEFDRMYKELFLKIKASVSGLPGAIEFL